MKIEGRPALEGRVLPPLGRVECPVCQEENGIALGGQGGAWFECTCGSYSPLCGDWETAYKAWDAKPQRWGGGANMYPEIGLPGNGPDPR